MELYLQLLQQLYNTTTTTITTITREFSSVFDGCELSFGQFFVFWGFSVASCIVAAFNTFSCQLSTSKQVNKCMPQGPRSWIFHYLSHFSLSLVQLLPLLLLLLSPFINISCQFNFILFAFISVCDMFLQYLRLLLLLFRYFYWPCKTLGTRKWHSFWILAFYVDHCLQKVVAGSFKESHRWWCQLLLLANICYLSFHPHHHPLMFIIIILVLVYY